MTLHLHLTMGQMVVNVPSLAANDAIILLAENCTDVTRWGREKGGQTPHQLQGKETPHQLQGGKETPPQLQGKETPHQFQGKETPPQLQSKTTPHPLQGKQTHVMIKLLLFDYFANRTQFVKMGNVFCAANNSSRNNFSP